jgi:hypothetical protein
MHRRFLGLAPLLAVVALVVGPAAAQATVPHWYLGSTPLKPGKKMSVKTEGKLLFSIPGSTIQVSCAVKDVETLLNPVGGGAGTDLMKAFNLSACGPNPCPVLSSGKQGALKVNALKLPWASRLVEIPPIADEISGIELEFSCKKVPFITVSGTLFPWVNPGFLEFTTATGTLSGMVVTGIDLFNPPGITANNP